MMRSILVSLLLVAATMIAVPAQSLPRSLFGPALTAEKLTPEKLIAEKPVPETLAHERFVLAYQDASPPSVTLVPESLDFGNQVVRRSSAARKIVVRNTGGKPLTIDSVQLTGDNPNSFVILNDACTGATVDPNQACVVEVNFTPTTTGERNARLKLTDNALDSPQRVRLTGIGINSNDVAPF